jgi:hypothetical protein
MRSDVHTPFAAWMLEHRQCIHTHVLLTLCFLPWSRLLPVAVVHFRIRIHISLGGPRPPKDELDPIPLKWARGNSVPKGESTA